jgi:transposase
MTAWIRPRLRSATTPPAPVPAGRWYEAQPQPRPIPTCREGERAGARIEPRAAAGGFNKLYEDGSIQEAPCMAHIRRKFFDLMPRTSRRSQPKPSNASRFSMRSRRRSEVALGTNAAVCNARALPLIESMHLWLLTSLGKLSRKSDTAAAIHYALSLWDAMVRYLDDGRIEIDNSAAERALRGVAVGRRTISSPAPIAEANAPPSSIPSSGRPSSTASIPKP